MSVETKVESFKPNDLLDFRPQKMQEDEFAALQVRDGLWEYLEHIDTVTLSLNGSTIAIYGLVPLQDNGALGWIFFSDDITKDTFPNKHAMVIAFRLFKTIFASLKEVGYEWIHTPVRTDFPQGERMVKMLGFNPTEEYEDLLDNGTQYRYWRRTF